MFVGDKIRKYRIDAGQTQQQLAERIGVATITIRQYELGKREPNLETLQKIAEALGVEPWQLMGYDGSIRVDTGKHSDKPLSEQIEDLHKAMQRLGEAFKPTDDEMLKMNCNAVFSYMEKMNRAGQAVVVKTAQTLSEMPEYQKKDEPSQK